MTRLARASHSVEILAARPFSLHKSDHCRVPSTCFEYFKAALVPARLCHQTR